MEILLNIPDDIGQHLRSRWDDLSRRALEALIADAFREDAISGEQAQRALGLGTRWELDSFLKQRGIYLDYGERGLCADIQTLGKLLGA